MSFCPGYLSITINDLQDAEELFRYDVLIFCPTSFNMSFKVPNRGQKPDRTFEMRLEDAKKSYRQVQILISDASGGPPPRSKFFFHAVFGKNFVK